MEEAIFLKEISGTVFIKARGHITAALCSDLKARVLERMESLTELVTIKIDLSECSYMDSTFMGLLVGFNKRLLSQSREEITLIRPSSACIQLLTTIGILKLVKTSDEILPFPPSMENIVSSNQATADFLLDVHENLMDISEENKVRFSTLHAILQAEKSKTD